MKKKQLTPEQIEERVQRVMELSSVVPLSQIPDKTFKYFSDLTDVNLRKLREPEMGIYIAESSKVIRRALSFGHRPVAFMMSHKWADDLIDVLQEHSDIPAYVGTEEELEKVTGYHLHRGALAAMARPEPRDLAELLDGARRVAVLEDIVDHTNVGAIFRSSAALGVDAVLVTPRCADPLYRRSIRVSMGTVFQVPWARLENWPQDIEKLGELGFETAALALTDQAITVDELAERNPDKLALILGTEGHGLAASTLKQCTHTVIIPMKHGVDSLNVAAASAVAFWETRAK